MANQKTKLELTWIGKENRPRLEPRILLEDPALSYHAAHRVTENDIFDNRLIFGDNLLALKALEQEFAGKIKCVYSDPPYNTGYAFTHFDDGIEHSLWLSLIRDRLEILWRLLARDGSLWISTTMMKCRIYGFSWMKFVAERALSPQMYGRNATHARTEKQLGTPMNTWSYMRKTRLGSS